MHFVWTVKRLVVFCNTFQIVFHFGYKPLPPLVIAPPPSPQIPCTGVYMYKHRRLEAAIYSISMILTSNLALIFYTFSISVVHKVI